MTHFLASFIWQPQPRFHPRPAAIQVHAPWLEARRPKLVAMFAPRTENGIARDDVVVGLRGQPMPELGLQVIACVSGTKDPSVWTIYRMDDRVRIRTFMCGRTVRRCNPPILGQVVGLIRGGLAEAEFDETGAIVLERFINPPLILKEFYPCLDLEDAPPAPAEAPPG